MKHQLVIARYKENIDWATGLPAIVYDKGGLVGLGLPGGYKGMEVVTVNENPSGHETHSYLLHIINHYDDLAEWTAFCQGNPFDHHHEFLARWNMEPGQDGGFDFLADWCVADDAVGMPHHPTLPMGAAYEAIFRQPSPNNFHFGAGAQFIASRELIRSRPRGFYMYVQDLGFIHRFEREWGYIMERMWFRLLHDPYPGRVFEEYEVWRKNAA